MQNVSIVNNTPKPFHGTNCHDQIRLVINNRQYKPDVFCFLKISFCQVIVTKHYI